VIPLQPLLWITLAPTTRRIDSSPVGFLGRPLSFDRPPLQLTVTLAFGRPLQRLAAHEARL